MKSLPSALSADRLVAGATEAAGLDDFGPGAWHDGLDRLVESANTEGDLNDIGVNIVEGRITNTLRQRLEIHDGLARRPEPLDVPVDRSAIVVGLPRTGTMHCRTSWARTGSRSSPTRRRW
jgi:hypothetical protein